MSDQDHPEPNPENDPSCGSDIKILEYCIENGWNIERDDQGLSRLIGDFSGTPLEGIQALLTKIAGFIPRLGVTERELDKIAVSLDWMLKTCVFFELLEDETEELEGMEDAGGYEDLENFKSQMGLRDEDLFGDPEEEEDELDQFKQEFSDNWWRKGETPPFFGGEE